MIKEYITFVISAYNQEQNIVKVINEIKKYKKCRNNDSK